MLRTALTLAKKRLAVFPCAVGGKTPLTAHGCKDASVDLGQIRAWWRQQPDANIGVATGAISNIFVVDIDGLDGEASMRQLECENGALPDTVESITGGGGRHLFFKWQSKRPVGNSVSRIAPHVDTRGDSGYIVAPPSLHPSGKNYVWSVDSAAGFAEAPAWLLDRLTKHTATKTPAAPSAWRELVADGVDEGQRDNAATRLSGYLLRHYLDPLVVLEILRLWNTQRCRPPLSADDIERVVDSIAGTEMRRRGRGH